MSWTVTPSSSAIRDLDRLPPRVLHAVVEFVYGPLAGNPRRVGKPLRDNLAGQWSARRGAYRVLYELDESAERVVVVRVDHWADVYRRR